MTLTWNNSTDWATSAKDEALPNPPEGRAYGDSAFRKGLTDFGKQVVKHMNELGMMVDLSHVGEQTFWDAIHTTTKPVLVSHSCVYALCPVFRNLKDDQIKAVGKNGGVIQVNFYSGFLDSTFDRKIKSIYAARKSQRDSLQQLHWSSDAIDDWLAATYKDEMDAIRPPLSLLMDHIDYIVKLIGVDHVGLGSDFDGISSAPQGLDGVQDFPLITKALLQRGYAKKDIDKILGGNFIRVFQANSIK
jgi:membrane dipeptidase